MAASAINLTPKLMAKILIVEDDNELAKTVSDYLRFEHHTVEHAPTGTEGIERLRFYQYDVVILDLNLPGMGGMDVCREYRSIGGNSPILMLTGNDKISSKEEGLDSGADDYLTKPFHMKELSARVRALLRRAGSRLASNVLAIGNVVLDPSGFSVTRNGEEVRLVPKEFALLEFLMRHPNVVFSPEALISRVWTAGEESSPDIIRTHIKNLRKKLDIPDENSIIHTVHGVGYKVSEPKSK